MWCTHSKHDTHECAQRHARHIALDQVLESLSILKVGDGQRSPTILSIAHRFGFSGHTGWFLPPSVQIACPIGSSVRIIRSLVHKFNSTPLIWLSVRITRLIGSHHSSYWFVRPSALRDASQIICMQQGSISRAGGTYMVRFKAEGEDGETSDVATVDVASLRPATQSEVTVVFYLCLPV